MRYLLRLCSVGVALGGSLVLAPAAAADPAGCTVDRPIIGLATDGRLSATVTASCDKSAKRYLRGEIKWDKRRAPDPLTASYTDEGTKLYDAGFGACDRGHTRNYYARGFFTPGSDYHDSVHRKLTVNC
ncbi:MAG TPA: hypothetical protein VGD11_01800 [Mycobacteriales bacterium]|jgi:hypothetical protein